MKMEYPTSFESIYTGGFSGLNPDHSEYFLGTRLDPSRISTSILPTNPNQLEEVSKAIKTGQKNVEVQAIGIQGDTDQAIPKQQFQEIKALMKLSGVKPSLHGPILDAAGVTQRGLNESERLATERRFGEIVDKAHILDDEGNIPVVFHASAGYPGTIVWKRDKDGKLAKDDDGKLITEVGHVIDQETGQMRQIRDTKIFRPDRPKELIDKQGNLTGHDFMAEDKINSINRTEWDNQMIKVSEFAKQAREVIGNSDAELAPYANMPIVGEEKGQIMVQDPDSKTKIPLGDDRTKRAYKNVQRASQFMENATLAFNSAFETAFKYGNEGQRKLLKKLAEDYKKENEAIQCIKKVKGKKYAQPTVFTPIKEAELLDQFAVRLGNITHSTEDNKGNLISGAPQLYRKVENFVIDKTAETFGNVAFESYKKYGEGSPVIALENIDPDRGAIVTADQMRETVQKTRDNFIERLVKEKKIGEKKAKKIAENLVGATWDLGHININKKYGWTDKEVVEETRKIADMVKHVHISDNFGHSDSDLAPGMGNVPMKKHLEELEKKGILGRVKTVVESGGWNNMIKGSAFPHILKAFGSPIYGINQTGGYWNQASGTFGGYFGGYGTINPQMHHSIYGAGLTTLPMELGGAIPGGASRFSGNSMA